MGIPHRNFLNFGRNMSVKIQSYAKINLTLEIVGEAEGYHLLDSLVASVDLYDEIRLKRRKDRQTVVKMHGLGSEYIPMEQNNAFRSANAFCEAFQTTGAEIEIFKNIPIGAGLGGSSADVSGVLNGMAELYGVEDRKKLKEIADGLGSDTGYMLTGGFARMRGRGTEITPILADTKLHLLLFCPRSDVSSGACYREYDRLQKDAEKDFQTEKCLSALLQKEVNGVGRYLTNDLFEPAKRLNQDVEQAYQDALSFSPLGVAMTGSGSCVFALFETKELCEWAKSRYKGDCDLYVVETIIP